MCTGTIVIAEYGKSVHRRGNNKQAGQVDLCRVLLEELKQEWTDNRSRTGYCFEGMGLSELS